jgi:aspartate-semialdehyde dehydrogenase
VKVAIVGVTGAVGETILRVLDERSIRVDELGAFASRARPEPLVWRGRPWPIAAATGEALRSGFDVVFFASSDDASADLAGHAVAGGAVVIDNSATFRMRDDVPLVIPEVNPQAIREADRIFPVANCTAIVLCVALAPIARAVGLRGVRVATYQAVSGAGRAGLEALEREEKAAYRIEENLEASPFVRQIFRNVIPQVGSIDEFGDSGEEKKIAAETRKMLGLPNLRVAATAVRVPVRYAHSVAAFIETERETDAVELGEAVAGAPGLVFLPDGSATPRDVEGQDLVYVSRLRAEGGASKRHFQLWAVGDQIRKGAATNAVQILELLLQRGLVGKQKHHV